MRRLLLFVLVVLTMSHALHAESPLPPALAPVMAQAQELFQQEKYADVIATLAAYTGADHPVRHLLAGHAQSRLERGEEAIAAYRIALSLDAEYRPAGIALAQAYARQKQWNEVLPLGGRFINPEKDRAEELVFYAQAAYHAGDKRLCEWLTHRCMERFPLDRRCRQLDLILLLENRDWPSAAQAALLLLQETPTDALLWNQYACAVQSTRENADSPAALEAAWLSNPTDKEARLQYFSSQLGAGHISRVIADGERLLQATTSNQPAPSEDAALLEILLRAADAIGDDARVRQWMGLIPEKQRSREILLIAARSALRRNDRSAARDALRHLIEHGQARAAEFLWAARLAEEAGDLPSAEADCREAIKRHDTGSRLAQLHLARLLWTMKRYAQAREQLSAYLSLFPEDAAARSMQLVFQQPKH